MSRKIQPLDTAKLALRRTNVAGLRRRADVKVRPLYTWRRAANV